jgi:hypothetical protein
MGYTSKYSKGQKKDVYEYAQLLNSQRYYKIKLLKIKERLIILKEKLKIGLSKKIKLRKGRCARKNIQ